MKSGHYCKLEFISTPLQDGDDFKQSIVLILRQLPIDLEFRRMFMDIFSVLVYPINKTKYLEYADFDQDSFHPF